MRGDVLGSVTEYDRAVTDRWSALESLGLKTSLLDGSRCEADRVFHPEASSWLGQCDPEQSVLVVQGDGVFCKDEDVRACWHKHLDSGEVVAGVVAPEDHPCTLSTYHEIVAGGFLVRESESVWLGDVDGAETPLLVLTREPDGAFRCAWNRPVLPDHLSLQIFFMDEKGNEQQLGPMRFHEVGEEVFHLLEKDLPVSVFVVSLPVSNGPCDMALRYLPERRSWDVGNIANRMVNCHTGEVIHGRQAYPEAYQIETRLVAGKAGDLLRFEHHLEEGTVSGVTVCLEIPPSVEARRLAASGVKHIRQRRPASPEPASAGYLAEGVSRCLERLDHTARNRFRLSKAFTSLSSYGAKGAAGVSNDPASNRVVFRLLDTLAVPGLDAVCSVELLSDGRLAACASSGQVAVMDDEGTDVHLVPGYHPFRLFSDGDNLFACDKKNRAILGFDHEMRSRVVLDFLTLDTEHSFAPLQARAFENGCVVMVKDMITNWTTMIRFDFSDPAGTVRFVDTEAMLIPCAAFGRDDDFLIVEKQPFCVWRQRSGSRPEPVSRRVYPDWVVGCVQGDDFSVLALKRSLIAVGPDYSFVDRAVQMRDLTSLNAPYTPDCSSVLTPDGVFLMVESGTGRILKLQARLMGGR